MANPTSFLNVLNGTETTQSLLLGAGCTVGGRPITNAGANVVNTTATTLALTAVLHAGKKVVVDSAAPIAITLPAATGTGDVYEIIINTAATGTAHTISTAGGTEYMAGVNWAATTSANAVIAYVATATSAIISLNGSTLGGKAGDKIVLIDVKTSIWNVQSFTAPTGSTATPFAHI